LDLRHQLEVMHTLRDITRERNTVTIVALHDLNLAARFADHILLMKAGQVCASGATEEILASPTLAKTYDVNIELQRSGEGVLMVGASL
jgi:iron complex transport system ATP-binding protein